MDLWPVLGIKEEKGNEIDVTGEYYDIGFDVKVKVENASPTPEEIDWCVDNCSLFGNKYVNYYDELIEYSDQECLICHKRFDDVYTMLQHNMSHMKVDLTSCFGAYQYKCKSCRTYFNSADKLDTHSKKCTKSTRKKNSVNIVKNMRQCDECGKVLSYKTWHSHIREVHGFDKFVCQLCDKIFKCERYLRRHTMFVHGSKRPSWRFHKIPDDFKCKCKLCPAVLRNKHALKTHYNNCHSNEEVWCDICHSKFKSKPYLRTHMNRVHDGDGKKYFCECGKSYKSPRRLRIHKKNTTCGDI